MNSKLFTTLVLLALTAAVAPNETLSQTNIIQIVADDLGWVDLSTGQTNFGNGSPYHQTPNIDSLAAGGMAFTSFYAQPTCAPTRAALFTGQYAPRNGVHHVVGLDSTGDTTLLVPPVDGNNIKNESLTIGELLQSTSYTTAHIGKFHCTQNSSDIVTHHGFDLNIGGTNSGGPSGTNAYFASQNNNGAWVFSNAHGPELDVYAQPYSQQYIDDNLLPYANGNDPTTLLNTPKHLNDAMADATIDFLADRVVDNEPFFVNVAFNAVHSVVNSRPDLETKYNGLTTSTSPLHDDPAYAGLMEGMDQAIGRIIDYVDQNGLSGNTIIIFMSDNGGAGVTDNFPLPDPKGSFRDGGIRVPLIAYMPGSIAAGTTNNEAIHPVDFYKTYATLANATLPTPETHALDGESFAGILNGTQTELTRRTIFYHFPGYTNQASPSSIALHDGMDGNRYKLTYFYEDRSFEFYDLTNDISESTNLIESGMTQVQFEVALDARLELTNWLHEVDAELLTVRASGNVVPLPSHSPAIKFALDTGAFGASLDGETMGTVSLLGTSMTLEAEGSMPEFAADVTGIGVSSDLDTGGPAMRQRIDGSLTNPEGIIVSFDSDVLLKQLDLIAFSDVTESVKIQYHSGENPLTGLNGYDSDGFAITNDTLTYVRNDGSGPNNPLLLRFGRLDQDELLVKAGTKLRITIDPSVGGGALLSSISVAIPATLPTVASVAIDENTSQRSAVESVTVTFDGSVDVEEDAISIIQLSNFDGLTGTPVESSFAFSESDGDTTVLATFDSLTRNGAGQLVDGNYQVTIDRQKVRLNGLQMAEDFVFGDEESDRFFSFYGDSNGDRTVNIFDLLAFRQSYGTFAGDAAYDFFMDYDAGGAINIFDLLQFRTRYGMTLPFTFGSSRSSLTLTPSPKRTLTATPKLVK